MPSWSCSSDWGTSARGPRLRAGLRTGPRFWPKRSLPKAREPVALAAPAPMRGLGLRAPGVPGALPKPGLRAAALRAASLPEGALDFQSPEAGAACRRRAVGSLQVRIDEGLFAGLGVLEGAVAAALVACSPGAASALVVGSAAAACAALCAAA